jgi:hypothetical protein
MSSDNIGPTFLRVDIATYKKYIQYSIDHDTNMLLEGRPGIGKTEIAKTLATVKGRKIHILHPANYDYGDLATKIPAHDTGAWKMVEVFDNSLPTEPNSILILDDFTHGDKGVTRQFYRLIQEGKLGSSYELPANTTIIAIYNPTDDVEAEELEGPLIDRFRLRIALESSKDEVISYFETGEGSTRPYASYVASFLRFKPDLLTLQNQEKGNRYELTPRRWDYLTLEGAKIGEGKMPEFRFMAMGVLPYSVGLQFDEFVKKIEIFQGDITRFVDGSTPFPEELEDQYAVMAAVVGHLTTDAKYEPLIDKVLDMKMRDANEEIKALIVFQSLRTYKKRKGVSNLNALMTGGKREKILAVLRKFDYVVDAL